MQRDKREVEANLQRKGFRAEERDHNFLIYYTADGRRSHVRTKTSHGTSTKSLGDTLLTLMARQCKLTKADFLKLVDCPLDQDGYEKLLVAQGDI